MSVYHEAPGTERSTTASGDEICHAVCDCQYDAVPRIAMCGTDCTDATESDRPIFPCVVCVEVNRSACKFCGATL